MKEAHRQWGIIDAVRHGDEGEGRFLTCWLFVNFKGSVQGFGGYVLNEHLEAWKADVCRLFDVDKVEDAVGKYCYALRCFSGWGEGIEGLEAVDGRRFTATDFFRRHLSKPVESVLEKRRAEHQNTIASLTRRINDEARHLAGLETDYVDWSATPLPSEDSKR